MKPEPLDKALEAAGSPESARYVRPPSGRLLTQSYAEELSREAGLVSLCGRYGRGSADYREQDHRRNFHRGLCVVQREVAALVLVDAIYRLMPGVISGESLEEESFSKGLLEYPQYTRPALYDTMRVPDVVLSGNHAQIARWRLKASILKTLAYRPELLTKDNLAEDVARLLREAIDEGGWHEPGTVHSSRTDEE